MSPGLQRAVWRWHMLAGLLVLPVLAWMAATGAIYLFKPEIERWLYADMLRASPAPALPIEALRARVEAATGGTVTQVIVPERREAWRMTLATTGGDRTAFVDPGSGAVRGTTERGGAMQTLRTLHSLAIAGPIANAVTEIAAGWAIVLVASGWWMWWPRRSLAVRGPPRARGFWRDLHATTGAVAGVVILFLALTGMTWTGVWGSGLQAVVAATESGRPPAPTGGGGHGDHHGAESLSWSRQRIAPPAAHGRAIGADVVAQIAADRGLVPPLTMTLPRDAASPWLVAAMATRAGDARAMYIDGADGRVLQDARYPAFGRGARAVEWGIAVHEGREYGEPNRWLMLAGAIGLLLLCLTAPVMLWKRRPRNVPRGGPGDARAVGAMMVAAGVLFPLTGLSMIAAGLVSFAAARLRT